MSEKATKQPELEFVAFVGIDWADHKHVWCLQAAGSRQREYGELEHKPETVEAWMGELCCRFCQGPIAVAVEQTKGALMCMLRKYECLHLFPGCLPACRRGCARRCIPRGAGRQREPSCGSCRRLTNKHCLRISPGAKAPVRNRQQTLSSIWFTLNRLRIGPLPPPSHGYSADQRHCGRCQR